MTEYCGIIYKFETFNIDAINVFYKLIIINCHYNQTFGWVVCHLVIIHC